MSLSVPKRWCERAFSATFRNVWIDLASAVLPRRWREKGLLLMLKAYFDDAGTHAGAPIAVMGGLIGTVAASQ